LFEGATAAEKLGDLPKAIEISSALIKLEPSEEDFRLRRGNLYVKAKQYKEAEDDFSQSLQIEPGDAVAFEARAELRMTCGKYSDAATDFTKAIEDAPDNASLLLLKRAGAYEKMGRADLAARDKQSSVKAAMVSKT
jgi:tetratricopeptide (TPR) repeat protein